jgi:leader peptidase (prepilin peptidase)/N-methyltransferase
MAVARVGTHVPAGLLAVALGGLAFFAYPLGGHAFLATCLVVTLVVVASIDIASFRIPNRIVLPAAAIALATNVALTPGRADEFVLAGLVAGGVLLLPNLIHSDWMGMGDVKLGLLLGAALGWGVIGALELAFIAVLPFAIVVRQRARRQVDARPPVLPFGPFLAFGALFVLIVPRLVGLGG